MQEKTTQQSEFSVNLRFFLKQVGWRQKDLAEKIGVSPVTVNRWIQGVNNISVEYLEAISEALGVEIGKLTGQISPFAKLTQEGDAVNEPTYEEWKQRALVAEAKLKHLQSACTALGQHVAALGSTVEGFSKIISE